MAIVASTPTLSHRKVTVRLAVEGHGVPGGLES